jgi:hypothetical protein
MRAASDSEAAKLSGKNTFYGQAEVNRLGEYRNARRPEFDLYHLLF